MTAVWPAAVVDLPPVRPLPSPWPTSPTATDPALAGWEPPTLDDLGLTADPVAQVLYLRGLAAEIELAMDDLQRAELAQYEPARHLRSVA